MKRIFTIITLLAMIILAGCMGGLRSGEKKNRSAETGMETDTETYTGISDRGEAGTYNGTYTGYYNERYGYGMEYPDILIPQGEADSGDGQAFVSGDGSATLRVYHDFRSLSGDPDPIEKAYRDDVKRLKPSRQKLHESHYELQGTTADGKQFSQVTIRQGDEYYTIAAEYDKADAELFDDIVQHAFNSFYVMGSADPLAEFVIKFADDCYWEKNFNRLLRDNDGRLASYIDPEMDVRRYYNPGAVAYLYDREKNFGFDDYTDFDLEPELGGEVSVARLSPDEPPCELEFRDERGYFILYYGTISSLPDEVVNPETFETRPIELPYPNAELLAVYIPGFYNEFIHARGFYFVNTPDGWKLAFVDDSLCSA